MANRDTSSECSNNANTYSIKASVDKSSLMTEKTIVVKRSVAPSAEGGNAEKRRKSPSLSMLMPKSVEKTDKVLKKASVSNSPLKIVNVYSK